MVTPEQIRAARALLRLEQDELARRAGVSVSTIRRLEAYSAGAVAAVAAETAAQVRGALEEAGVEFIYDGVMKKAGRDDAVLFAELRAIAERSAAELAGSGFTDKDLYGDDGLPA